MNVIQMVGVQSFTDALAMNHSSQLFCGDITIFKPITTA